MFSFWRQLRADYPGRFLLALASTHFGLKGLYMGMAGTLALPFFKALGVTGDRYHDYITVAMLPWACKPFCGLLSDAVYLGGYSKRYYVAVSALVGALAALLLAVAKPSANTAAGLFTLGNAGVMVIDLLMEGKYSELMATRAEGRGGIVTYVWFICLTGGLLASITVGPMADKGLITAVCWIASAVAAQGTIPPLLGWIPEVQNGKRWAEVRWQKLRDHREIFGLAAAMGLVAVGLVFVTIYADYVGKLVYGLTGSVFLIWLTFRVMPPTLARCNCFLFLADALSVSLGGSIQYFFTAGPECLVDGPHFSYLFFYTWSSLVSAVFGVVGLFLFQWKLQHFNIRYIFMLTTLLRVIGAMFDIIITKRWNLAAGIPDKWMYMLGDNIVEPVIGMMALMPMVLLTSKLCTRGMESTMYALLAGFQNFGSSVSRSAGAFVIHVAGIGGCDFANLPLSIAVCNMILPLVCVPLAYWLLPNMRLSEPLGETTENEDPPPEEPLLEAAIWDTSFTLDTWKYPEDDPGTTEEFSEPAMRNTTQ